MRFIVLIPFAALIFFMNLAHSKENQSEEYFHQIYKKYHSQPTPQFVWEGALSKRSNQEYTVIEGDTLWDVSRTLFMDGFFWSKIWSLNPYIKNPHQIKAGQIIRFFPGAGLDAPGLQVHSPPTDVPVITPETSLSQTKWWSSEGLPLVPEETSSVKIPPSGKRSATLDDFPPSLPNWYFGTDSEIEKAPLEIVPIQLPKIENVLNVPFYISEFPQNIKGDVYEIEKNATTASERDYLFIDAEEELKTGDIYTVIESIGTIRDPEAVGDFPLSYEVQGEIKIVGRVENYYKAVVVKSLFPIKVGANIVPGPGPKMNLTEPGEQVSLKAMIVGGENDTTRSLFGPQSIIYINRGSSDGVKVNQRAPVSAIHRLRHSESTIFSNTWKIGEVKIVKVEKNYSTAVVMMATEGIMPGDIVGELHPSDITEKFKRLDSNTQFGDGFESDFGKKRKKKLLENDSMASEGDDFNFDEDEGDDFSDEFDQSTTDESSAESSLKSDTEGSDKEASTVDADPENTDTSTDSDEDEDDF